MKDYSLNSLQHFQDKFNQYGYSPKALGWDKGKQDVRFDILTSQYDFNGKSVLDIGCGFGDLNKTLSKFKDYRYHGIDIIKDFITTAKTIYIGENTSFEYGDFLKTNFNLEFDYIIASGIFNLRLTDNNNYEFVEAVMNKAFDIAKDGLAFDFLSDKVDYRLEHTFHFNPAEILSIAYKKSRNVILRNDYMPFEFSLFIFRDDSFAKEDTLFTRYKENMKFCK